VQNAGRAWPLKTLIEQAGQGVDGLFRNIAEKVAAFAGGQGGRLGHTFSYPSVQTGIHEAKIKNWTKEVAVCGAESTDVNGLLRQKLLSLGRADIIPAVILNDTTAALLAGAYQTGGQNCVGSICGTGHNSCYYEPRQKMILNLEAGNFAPACRNRFDRELDLFSASPGGQLMEKMTAGDYLAKLTTIAARELAIDARMNTAAELAAALDEEKNPLLPLARAVIQRAAALLAAEYCGISLYLAGEGITLERVFIDGSVYNKIPLFRQELDAALARLSENPPQAISGDNSSLLGAAVACAVAT
jgi:hexokinase